MSAEITDKRRDRLKLVDPALETANPTEARQPAETTSAPPPEAAQPPAKRSPVRRAGLTLLAAVALGAGLWYGIDWWRNGRFIVSTDDAYVGAEMATISAKLAANIAKVSVVQNQEVKAGQPLVTLDAGDWQIALASARAKTATARATLARIDSQI